MLKRFAAAALALSMTIACLHAHATAQAPDRIVIEGKEYPLNTNPLGGYLAGMGMAAPHFDSPHTALWRGYIATWELADGKLYLRGITGYRQNPAPDEDMQTGDMMLEVDGMAELFPAGDDVVATWFTGALIVPDGKLVDYVHMGYGSTFERYIVSIVREGIEVEQRRLSLGEFRKYRNGKFERYKTTDEYARLFEETKSQAGDMTDSQIEDFIEQYEAETYLSGP